MDMTYRVSKNAYIELLADMVSRNDSRPIKLLTTFLLPSASAFPARFMR